MKKNGKTVGKITKRNRAIARERKHLEAEDQKVPRTMIFCKPNVSKYVKLLTENFKTIFEPYTTKELKCNKKNVMKDFIDMAGPLNVKTILFFNQTKASKTTSGGVYMHVIGVPHGPTFTYRINNFHLKSDVQRMNGYCMNKNALQMSPSLVMSGFEENMTNYQRSVILSFQNMIPPIVASTRSVDSIKRLVQIHRKGDPAQTDSKLELGEEFSLRHYFISHEAKQVGRALKKLGLGVAGRNATVPDMSKFASIDQYFESNNGALSESDMSDVEGGETTFELKQNVKSLGGASGVIAPRLTEVGPAIDFVLVKIEEGVQCGAVLYHRFVKKTNTEIIATEQVRKNKEKLRENRKKEQQKNVEIKKKKAKDHREKCISGLKMEDDKEEKKNGVEMVNPMNDDDEVVKDIESDDEIVDDIVSDDEVVEDMESDDEEMEDIVSDNEGDEEAVSNSDEEDMCEETDVEDDSEDEKVFVDLENDSVEESPSKPQKRKLSAQGTVVLKKRKL